MAGGYIGTAPADRDPVVGNEAVTTAKIADDAVTAAKLANSINTEISANTAKVSNATHTGDVTGATALTIANDAVSLVKNANRAAFATSSQVAVTEHPPGATSKDLAPTSGPPAAPAPGQGAPQGPAVANEIEKGP